VTQSAFWEAPEPLAPDAKVSARVARWYQREAKAAILNGFRENHSLLCVMATGLGKTFLFCDVAAEWTGGKILVVAHRDELLTQAVGALAQVGLVAETEKAEQRASLRAEVVVASIQTLSKDRRLEQFGKDHFSLIIIDEGHRATADSYRKVMDYFDAKVLLVTATPDRTDETALGTICDEVVYVRDILDGIDDGYLVPIVATHVDIKGIDLTQVSTVAGELNQGQLDEVILRNMTAICTETLNKFPDRTGIVFCPGVASAAYGAAKSNELRPGSACFISGETDPDERREIVRDFRAGRYKLFFNCDVATEGWDSPNVDMVVHASPTMSRMRYAQRSGRGTRVLPGLVDHLTEQGQAAERRAIIAASSKANMMLVDYMGNAGKHSLVSPVDVLGGNFSEAEITKAKEILKKNPGGDVRVAIRHAQEHFRALARAAAAKVQAEHRRFDPFKVLEIDHEVELAKAQRWGWKPATENQASVLLRAGIREETVKAMSKAEASKAIDKIVQRRKQGLATLPMVAALKKWGIDADKANFKAAGDVIGYLKSTRTVDKGRVASLLRGSRQPGED